MKRVEIWQDKLEWLTRKWWFYLIFVIVVMTVPPYASKGYDFPVQSYEVTMQAIIGTLLRKLLTLAPAFKIALITFTFLAVLLPKRCTRLFNAYVALMYLINSMGSIRFNTRFGVAVCTINVICFAVIAFCWALDAFVLKNDFTSPTKSIWRYWVVPLAFMAFWYPLSGRTQQPYFSPILLLTSTGGLAFCLITPVYLALLTIFWPRVNMVVLRVTALYGVFIGVMNMLVNFALRDASRYWWNGVLHIPLLVISLYSLIISLRKPRTVR